MAIGKVEFEKGAVTIRIGDAQAPETTAPSMTFQNIFDELEAGVRKIVGNLSHKPQPGLSDVFQPLTTRDYGMESCMNAQPQELPPLTYVLGEPADTTDK